jgi:hypothetical protein
MTLIFLIDVSFLMAILFELLTAQAPLLFINQLNN